MNSLAALCAALAVLVAWGPSPDRRVRRLWSTRERTAVTLPVPIIAGCCAAATIVLYLDGVLRFPLGVAAGWGVWAWVRRSARADAAADPALTAALPVFVDLVVAGLRAGRPPDQAIRIAAAAVGPEVVAAVGPATHDDGRALAAHPELGRLGRAVQRSASSGAPVTETVSRLAEELRRDARARAEERARRVAVQTVGPLGACFLPAFLLVGVVPTIASAFSTIL